VKLRHLALILPLIALTACGTPPATTPSSGASGSSSTPVAATKTCVYVVSGRAPDKPVSPPPGDSVPANGTTTLTMKLTGGDVVMTMNRAGAPCAVNSIQWLASQKYFDNTDCHRLTNQDALTVLQCGDPLGTGNGGPGYSFADELNGKETYPRGTVAMANAGVNTNGSQFFIAIKDCQLPASYVVLGTVSTESLTVLDAILAAGIDPKDPAKAKPAWGAHIDTVTVG